MKFPPPPQEPLVDQNQHVTNTWHRAFAALKPMVLNVTAGTTVGTPNGDASVFVVQGRGILGPTTLQLPTTPTLGQTLSVKDVFGGASTNPVTIVPPPGVLIDGAMNAVIDADYGSLGISWNGTGWSLTGAQGPPGPTGASMPAEYGYIDGGTPTSIYGGIDPLDGGGP